MHRRNVMGGGVGGQVRRQYWIPYCSQILCVAAASTVGCIQVPVHSCSAGSSGSDSSVGGGVHGHDGRCGHSHNLRQTAAGWPPSRVPGEIKRSRDLRGGRWSWTLNLAQKRSWVGRWRWAKKVGLLLLRVVQVVRQQQCNGHCLFDSAQAQQLKQQLRSAQVAWQWRGDTALTLPLFWRRSTVSPVFFGRFPPSSLHSVVPFPLCPRP